MSLQLPENLNGVPERQVSTTSMTPLTSTNLDPPSSPDAETTVYHVEIEKQCKQEDGLVVYTAIPIREEFRCRRAWFFYHDIRALVTSWIPFPSFIRFAGLPVFIGWRLFMAAYIFAWLIAHIAGRNDEFGVRWLIYVTDLAYILLTIGVIALAVLTVWYTFLYYGFPNAIKSYIPQSIENVYREDNIPWFAKLCWALYLVGASLSPLVSFGYWVLVYRADCPTAEPSTVATVTMDSNGNSSNFTLSNSSNFTTSPTGGNIACSNDIDVYTLHFHCINAVLVLIDLFVSRVPYQFMHFFYPLFFMVPYVLFTVIYWGAGGTNPVNGERYIYESLEYSNTSAFGWAIGLALCPIPMYLILFLLAWVRDVISKYLQCYHSDLVVQYGRGEETVENGTNNESESTT